MVSKIGYPMDESMLQLLEEARGELLVVHSKLMRRKIQKDVWTIIEKIDAVIKAQELKDFFGEKMPRF